MKFSEVTKKILQDEIDEQLRTAIGEIEKLKNMCLDPSYFYDNDPQHFDRLIDALVDLRVRAT